MVRPLPTSPRSLPLSSHTDLYSIPQVPDPLEFEALHNLSLLIGIPFLVLLLDDFFSSFKSLLHP